MENVCIKAVDNYDNLFIVEPSKGISTISMMSDYGIHFFVYIEELTKNKKYLIMKLPICRMVKPNMRLYIIYQYL